MTHTSSQTFTSTLSNSGTSTSSSVYEIDFSATRKSFSWADDDEDDWTPPTPMFKTNVKTELQEQSALSTSSSSSSSNTSSNTTTFPSTNTSTVVCEIDFSATRKSFSWADDEEDDWMPPTRMFEVNAQTEMAEDSTSDTSSSTSSSTSSCTSCTSGTGTGSDSSSSTSSTTSSICETDFSGDRKSSSWTEEEEEDKLMPSPQMFETDVLIEQAGQTDSDTSSETGTNSNIGTATFDAVLPYHGLPEKIVQRIWDSETGGGCTGRGTQPTPTRHSTGIFMRRKHIDCTNMLELSRMILSEESGRDLETPIQRPTRKCAKPPDAPSPSVAPASSSVVAIKHPSSASPLDTDTDRHTDADTQPSSWFGSLGSLLGSVASKVGGYTTPASILGEPPSTPDSSPLPANPTSYLALTTHRYPLSYGVLGSSASLAQCPWP